MHFVHRVQLGFTHSAPIFLLRLTLFLSTSRITILTCMSSPRHVYILIWNDTDYLQTNRAFKYFVVSEVRTRTIVLIRRSVIQAERLVTPFTLEGQKILKIA